MSKLRFTTEEIEKQERLLGAGMARQFETKLSFKKADDRVLNYLRDLAARLAQSSTSLQANIPNVQVIEDKSRRWMNYGAPGNRLYLSSGLIRHVQFENELAAALAFELAHILKRHVSARMMSQKGVLGSSPEDFPSIEGLVPSSSDGASKEIDFFSPTGIFAYPDEMSLETINVAVELLYKAGFDSRGLVSLLNLYASSNGHSPYEVSLLQKMVDRTRIAVARYSPLRNPIVRSPEFVSMMKRFQKL